MISSKENVAKLVEGLINAEKYGNIFKAHIIRTTNDIDGINFDCTGFINIGPNRTSIHYEIGRQYDKDNHRLSTIEEFINVGYKTDIETYENILYPQLLDIAQDIRELHIKDFDIDTFEYDENYYTLDDLLDAIKEYINHNIAYVDFIIEQIATVKPGNRIVFGHDGRFYVQVYDDSVVITRRVSHSSDEKNDIYHTELVRDESDVEFLMNIIYSKIPPTYKFTIPENGTNNNSADRKFSGVEVKDMIKQGIIKRLEMKKTGGIQDE